MARKKPFSGKAKKAQLQAKRERKKEDATEGTLTDAQIRVVVDKLNHQPASEEKSRDINRYKLHFQAESKYDIEQRKATSRLPLHMLPRKCLEVAIEDIFSEDKVIDLPMRPAWDYSMSKEEVESNEEKMFQEWINAVYDKYGDEVSHFEHNVETWRQLWRVLEISDMYVAKGGKKNYILLLSDVRHPVLHFPPALYKVVVEDMKKSIVFVLNKIDLVTPATVDAWRDYFQEKFPKLHIACFTSYPNEQPKDIEEVFRKKRARTKRNKQMNLGTLQVLNACESCVVEKHGEVFKFSEWRNRLQRDVQQDGEGNLDDLEDGGNDYGSDESDDDEEPEELPELGELGEEEHAPHSDLVTIGVVGNPNVGKSSLLNGLMGKKVVSTSRTPGHTKHFQTIFLSKNIRLCDSPGLVFPSCVPKQLQVLSGIYPVAQVREPFTAIGYLAERVALVDVLRLDWPYDEDDEPFVQWSAWAICDAWAKKRGYLTAKAARLDTYRAANSLLRLAVDGRIVLSIKPPGFFERLSQEENETEMVSWRAQIDKEAQQEDESGTEEEESDSDHDSTLQAHSNPFALLGDT